MNSNQLLSKIIAEWREISGLDFALATWEGEEYLLSQSHKFPAADKLIRFAKQDALSAATASLHYYKIFKDGEPTHILIVWGKGTEAHTIGELAVCQIQSLLENTGSRLDKNTFMQNILLEQYNEVDMHNKSRKLHISYSTPRAVFVIETKKTANENILSTISNIFSSRTGNFITSLDEHSIILISELSAAQSYDDLNKIAHTLVDMLASETMVAAWAAYGNIAEDLSQLSHSYKEAKISLNVGKVFTPAQNTFGYRHLGIGHLIYHLPQDVCRMFIDDVFQGDNLSDLDEDTMDLINTFFDSNLNLSETARKLYLHRNTLVYRMEKLEKRFGLDIRKFDDAMTFKVAMMISNYLNFS